MTTFIIITCIIFVIAGYIIINLFKKLEKLESIVEGQNIYITKFSSTVAYTNKRLKEIDEKGSFQSDDEIGWFFESLKTLQTDLDDFNLTRKQ